MSLNDISEILKVVLQIANVVVLGYALYKFLNKPHDSLEEKTIALEKRVDAQDIRLGNIEKSLDSSHEKHREQKQTNEMFITCMLAFIDFEIAFCQTSKYENTDDLKKAKETLQKYLARK